MENQKIWFVTGASKGMGLLLTKLLLEKGEKVAAASRNKEQLEKGIGMHSDNFLPIALDITSSEDVKEAIKQTVQHYGGLI